MAIEILNQGAMSGAPAPIGAAMSFAALQQSGLELGCVASVDEDGRTIWILVRCLCRLRSCRCRLTIHKAFFDIAYLVSDAITGKL
ncbi:MAG: hypothetical protein DMF36_03985 [Verrucomicrobia bacterium]|nr:MAG: hypothetical protein DMF36_03985 [Verrucomicrobiota bacterium]